MESELREVGNRNYDIETKGFLFTFQNIQNSNSGVLSVYRKNRGRPVNLSKDPAPYGIIFLDKSFVGPDFDKVMTSIKNKYGVLVDAINNYQGEDLTSKDKSKLLKGLEGVISLN